MFVMKYTKISLNTLKHCRESASHPFLSALRQICWCIIHEQFCFNNFFPAWPADHPSQLWWKLDELSGTSLKRYVLGPLIKIIRKSFKNTIGVRHLQCLDLKTKCLAYICNPGSLNREWDAASVADDMRIPPGINNPPGLSEAHKETCQLIGGWCHSSRHCIISTS